MFKKATRKRAKLKLAITGPSGSGKTYSSLKLAKGLGGRIAVIDTENGSASLYSNDFDFDVLEISPPYTVEKYISGIKAAVDAGYDILVIDSISHQWRGEGGILNKKEQLDARGGNSFTNWAKLTPEQERFMAAILHAPIHTLCTIRSKQEYAMVDSGNGKQKIQKLGLAPIQRDGMEYEFTTVLDVAMNHEAEASKDRTGLFVDRMIKIDEQTGRDLKAWLESGEEPELKAAPTETAAPGINGDYLIEGGQFEGLTIREVVDKIGGEKAEAYGEWLLKNRPNAIYGTEFRVHLGRYKLEVLKAQSIAEAATAAVLSNVDQPEEEPDFGEEIEDSAYDLAKVGGK